MNRKERRAVKSRERRAMRAMRPATKVMARVVERGGEPTRDENAIVRRAVSRGRRIMAGVE